MIKKTQESLLAKVTGETLMVDSLPYDNGIYS